MLHELLDLRECLFESKNIGAETVFDRKLEIIENNLYGVDKEVFAVNIARLRLWLSLAVDFVGDKPKPLPNLKYKLEVGDSLLAPISMAQLSARDVLIPRYRELKAEYLRTHNGNDKKKREDEILAIKSNIATLTHGGNKSISGFDWGVEFAEVMADGGFDIQVANPPYVRMELFKEIKPTLKKNFPEAHSDRADLYCYFYARSLQLLKPSGMLAFISSNKWFRAGYGEKLRKHIADSCQISSITDFGDLPVFKGAAVLTMIFICQSSKSKNQEDLLRFTPVKSLEYPYPDIKEIINRDSNILPGNAIEGGNWLLTDNNTANDIKQMESKGIPLCEYVKGQILYGVKTGFNRAFVIDSETRSKLIFKNPVSEDIIKPLVVGDDVRKWHIKNKERYLLYMYHGINTKELDSVLDYLKPYRQKLEKRATKQEWYELQQPQLRYSNSFCQPKIIYPVMAQTSRFTFDTNDLFINDKVFVIPVNDLFLLGVLNSMYVWKYLTNACSELLGKSMELRGIYMNKVPIPQASETERKAISKLVQKCLDAKGVGCERWEREIDVLVGRLYGLEHNHDLN
jgi:TaqI-like C-terminal specificity domain/Eco57I restriction-modification methylase